MASRKTKKKDPSAKTPATQYEPTPQEIAAIKGYAERDKAKPSTRIKVSNEGAVPQLSVDHPDPTLGGILLSEALGTADSDFVAGLLDQISNAATKGRAPEEDKINFMFETRRAHCVPKREWRPVPYRRRNRGSEPCVAQILYRLRF